MTKEMYESLKVTDLRGIAKQRGVTVNPRMKKAELIDLMMNLDAQAAGGLSNANAGTIQADGERAANRESGKPYVHDAAAASDQDNASASEGSEHSEPASDRQHEAGGNAGSPEDRQVEDARHNRPASDVQHEAGADDALARNALNDAVNPLQQTQDAAGTPEKGEDTSAAVSAQEGKNAAAPIRNRRGRPPKNAKKNEEEEREGTHPARRGRKPAKQQKGQTAEQTGSSLTERQEVQKAAAQAQESWEARETEQEERAGGNRSEGTEPNRASGTANAGTPPRTVRTANVPEGRRPVRVVSSNGSSYSTRQNSAAGRTYITRANSNTAQNYSSGQTYIPTLGNQAQNQNMQNQNAAGQNAQFQNSASRYQNSQAVVNQNAQSSQNAASRYQSNQSTASQENSYVQTPASGYNSYTSMNSTGSTQQPQVNPNLAGRYERRGLLRPDQPIAHKDTLNKELDSGEMAHGILEVMPDGFGFIRSANYMPGEDDVYVAPSQIRRFNLKTGDILEGNIRVRTSGEKFSALLFVKSVNGLDPEVAKRRYDFEDMTPIFPNERIRLEQPTASVAMRVMDLFCPVGKGQRGMVVSPPKAGKTTLVKEVAKSVKKNNPEIHLIILLIDERPEEVTDIREALEGPNTEVIYSTFDELPEHHKRVSEMTIERAKRLVEQKRDVMILLDSITRLTRAYNLTEPSSGRTLTGGLDPVALHAPKRFFGAARNMREGGSLTILATALIETGSKMDDVVYEEFKGTGNMEVILNRKLSERRIFPAIDLAKSGTRRDDLLLTPDELDAVNIVRRAFIGARGEEATDSVLDLFAKTRTNGELVSMIRRHAWSY